jgi:sugar phosphate isomerase/epimerase
MNLTRRHFLSTSAAFASITMMPSFAKPESPADDNSPYKISLAQWSLHRALKGGKLDNLDWPAYTQENFDIHALEWVNQFFAEQKGKMGLQPLGGDYIAQMKKRCDDLGIKSLLIMCDGVGQIGDPNNAKRTTTVEGHYAWLDAAKQLGCHSIRVNSGSNARLPADEQAKLCADGLRRLSERAKPMGLNVIVENHGGLSSHGDWLAGVLKSVGMDNCGSLPDFGNFHVVKNHGNDEQFEKEKAVFANVEGLVVDELGLGFDRYQGVKLLMPFAKGVSAKSHNFNDKGEETRTDFRKMMKIVKEAGYMGYLGVEYEGSELSEIDGIKATKALLEKVIAELA